MNPLFTLHDEITAPESIRPLLQSTRAQLGFLPNLLAGMAEAPDLASTFMHLTGVSRSLSFTAVEREVAIIAVSSANGCDYCVANHLAILHRLKAGEPLLGALRNRTPIPEPRLEALHRFATLVVQHKGRVLQAAQEDFLAHGYRPAQALEVVLLAGIYAMSNYANRLLDVELDAAFTPFTTPALAAELAPQGGSR